MTIRVGKYWSASWTDQPMRAQFYLTTHDICFYEECGSDFVAGDLASHQLETSLINQQLCTMLARKMQIYEPEI